MKLVHLADNVNVIGVIISCQLNFENIELDNTHGMILMTVVRPVMIYGLEIAEMTKTGQTARSSRNENAKVSQGVTRKDRIRNDHIRGTLKSG